MDFANVLFCIGTYFNKMMCVEFYMNLTMRRSFTIDTLYYYKAGTFKPFATEKKEKTKPTILGYIYAFPGRKLRVIV